MAGRIFITRTDWMQDDAVAFNPSVGFWRPENPLTNLLDGRPQLAAEAVDNRDVASTRFVVDLGHQRRVGMIAFVALRACGLSFMQVQAGLDSNFEYNDYDTGMIPTWPLDSTPGGLDAWDRWTLNGKYQEDEYFALGMPRVLIPEALINIRYIRVIIRNQLARDKPLTIGCFGVYDVWEPLINFKYGWELTPLDESDVVRIPRGTTYVDGRGIRRRLNLGLDQLSEEDTWARGFGATLVRGKSDPFWVVPFTDTSQITRFEKAAVYGLISQDSVLSNPLIEGRYAQLVQIDQVY